MVVDELLIKKAQTGDLAAYGELIRRHQDRVYNMAFKMLNSPEDAKDASQDVFVRVFKSLSSYDFRASYTTWLYRVATNVCLDMLRKRSKELQRNLPFGEEKVSEKHMRDDRPSPEEVYIEREKLKDLRKAVSDLPEDYRMALILHHYQGLGYKEVAEVLKLPENTVATRIYRAKKMLKMKLLGGEAGAMPKSSGNDQQISSR